MAKPPGKCIFCSSGNLSKEHIWADWLKAYIPRTMDRHKATFVQINPEPAETTQEIRKAEGDPHSRRLRVVCRPCNQGWMSDLQQIAKPYLVPMLTGKPTSLYRNGQTAVAAWATMFVMTAEFLDREYVSISARERKWFMEHWRAPSHWRIWLGKYERPLSSRKWFHAGLVFAEDEREIVPGGTTPIGNTHTTTILLGNHVIIHIMSSSVMRRFIRNWTLLPAAAPAMSQIWPITCRRVGWPNAATISGRTIDELTLHFLRRCDAVARRMEAEDRGPSG